MAADRARLMEITADTTQLLPRGDPRLTTLLPALRLIPSFSRLPVSVLLPEFRFTWNSDLPYSLNDGPLWAGRGGNLSVTGGLALERAFRGALLRVVVAPTVVYSQNLPFQIFPNTDTSRSAFANPFHPADSGSIDLPHRFGDRHLLGFDMGRSGLLVETSTIAAGITGESQWWGPGIRNAITMSNNAPGIPRAFVRTGRPVRTRIGAIEAQLVAGTLTQSLFFGDSTPENRSLSGLLLQLRPAFDSNLTFGLARVVYAPLGIDSAPRRLTLSRAVDAVFRWERIRWKEVDTLAQEDTIGQRSDQITSIFARWIFPQAGLEVYFEWARMDLPRSLADVLVAPHHTGGYTLGFQWAPRRKQGYLRLQSEVTYLEQSQVFRDRPPPDFYSGLASPQGYTQRGQIIGAAIGPGASSQWIAFDYLARRWQFGGFLGRVRWDNDQLYRQFVATFFRHDVTILGGLRGGWRTPLTDFAAELTLARRHNYLFQNGFVNPGGYRTVDVNNLTLSLVATPR